ncbi:MAG: right-handed parallel beta-helix repeat-containing protein [Massilibacteroides sp.]|nr:right-handed parallel beta-helix repeat-containing protein [Massilibacteroides sp.]MDD3062034.1 right-handed parallel beta-helix repeat-containing protein [Massilibacteroides sp.]MDD4114847.1 right-handed parallel beta-helix repeat-containing protein [Massilibacteroides sp.]MDD4659249.1 right-handed parallel beta-helix repeat-containing protein [Massilibacteroides sp.]
MKKRIFYLFCFGITILQNYVMAYAESNERIRLSDYGAIPNDGKNDRDAFQLALNHCRTHPGTNLYIEPGVYNLIDDNALEHEYKAINGQYGEDVQGHFFYPKADYVIGLDLDRFNHITIDAAGVTLVQEGWYEALSITNAENVLIKGLKLAHKRPPFTTGVIIESTSTYFDMRVDTVKYPFLTERITGRVHFYDMNKQRIYTGGWNERKELIDPQTIRVYSQCKPQTGDLCILRHSGHGRAGILIKESSNITLEDVTIHSQPGMGVVGHRSENITLKNLQVIPAPGTVTSTNTDATHFTSCKGKIKFEGCKFGGQGDDCTNIHNYYWSLYKEKNPRSLKIAVEEADLHALSLDYPDPGDTLALVSKENLTPVEYYRVDEVTTSEKDWRVIVTLDKNFRYDPENYYITNITRRPSVEIINNTVRSHMARAFLIKTKEVRIAGNVIQSSSGSAIQLGAEASWRESGPVQQILIENNWIVGCGYGHGTQKGTAISAEVNGAKTKTNILNRTIIIRNNVIEAVGKNAIYISDTDGIDIHNNEISGSENAIYIKNAKNIDIKNNGQLPVLFE